MDESNRKEDSADKGTYNPLPFGNGTSGMPKEDVIYLPTPSDIYKYVATIACNTRYR